MTLQRVFGTSLDGLGRQTGVIRRLRKFSGATLVKTLVLTLMKSPNAKPVDYAATAARLGVFVTPEAVELIFYSCGSVFDVSPFVMDRESDWSDFHSATSHR
jgi:hypothetical protein